MCQAEFFQPGDYTFKIALLGEKGVGKSSLQYYYIHNTSLTDNIEMPSEETKVYKPSQGTNIQFEFKDTINAEQSHPANDPYWNEFIFGCQCVLCCFDLTQTGQLQKVQPWVASVLSYGGTVALIGCKSDGERQITKEEAKQYADDMGVDYYETSAHKGSDVESTFKRLCYKMMKM
uniref:Rab-like protein n=1 Tax=Trepomonas sp. PC1 TaxID=1076344 RepID=A0A146K6C1_9EUKA|eukprot:JAP91385.1 Rab-like protein [Trepomonas sp. PC1]